MLVIVALANKIGGRVDCVQGLADRFDPRPIAVFGSVMMGGGLILLSMQSNLANIQLVYLLIGMLVVLGALAAALLVPFGLAPGAAQPVAAPDQPSEGKILRRQKRAVKRLRNTEKKWFKRRRRKAKQLFKRTEKDKYGSFSEAPDGPAQALVSS